MRKLVTLVVFLCLISSQLLAQTQTVTGKVSDASGIPLSGAVIKVPGTQTVTLSTEDGSFSIKVPTKAKSLLISHIGQDDITVVITSGPLRVTMNATTKDLQEVVVVGYGTKLKRDVTGSVSTVGAKEISNTPATSFESAIQGRAAGVSVSQQNGKLGQGINIRIRGASSVTAGNEPL